MESRFITSLLSFAAPPAEVKTSGLKDPCSTSEHHEELKKNSYLTRVRDVERGSFNPLVFTVAGGAAKESTDVLKRLSLLISQKHHEPQSVTMGWMRTKISFFLIKSALSSKREQRCYETTLPSHLPKAQRTTICDYGIDENQDQLCVDQICSHLHSWDAKLESEEERPE